MWWKILDDNFFIKKLYNQVPELNNVNILVIKLEGERNKVSLTCDLPYYADYPPQKWIDAKYNTVIVQIDFFAIQNFNIQYLNNLFKGNVEIKLDENELIIVNITGSITAKIFAEAGIIQDIRACSAMENA